MEPISFTLDRLKSAIYHKQLYRMQAYEPINRFGVSAGDLGGLVENPNNIHNSWIEKNAMVVDQAEITNCCIRANSYISNNARINGNYYYLGGNMGDVHIAGNVVLNLTDNLDIGPITICDDCTLSNSDIISLCGIRPNFAYGGHLTIYKKDDNMLFYNHGQNLCELYISLLEEYHEEGINVEKTSIMALNKHIVALARSHFNI